MRGWHGKIAGLMLLALSGCRDAPPLETAFFNRGSVQVVEGQAGLLRLEQDLIQAVDSAQERVWLAAEGLESTPLARALIRAHRRGLDVRVVVDEDSARQAPVAQLLTDLPRLPSGEARVTLADGRVIFNPEPTRVLVRSSEMNRMTHNFLLLDDTRVYTWTAILGSQARRQWMFEATSRDIAKDFEDEANQLLGGVDATHLTYFDGPLKSNTNDRVQYPMSDGVWELYFGPQERLLKRVIDEVYAARSSVLVVTPTLQNAFLLAALKYKARVGKRVEVVVGSGLATATKRSGERGAKAQEDPLTELARNVPVVKAPDVGGTLVVLDAEPTADGRTFTTRSLVLSHALVESVPFDINDTSVPADAFMDGHMWILTELAGRRDPHTRTVVDSALRSLAEGEAL